MIFKTVQRLFHREQSFFHRYIGLVDIIMQCPEIKRKICFDNCSHLGKTKTEGVIIMVKSVNNNNFGAEVLQNENPVLVDFYAQWCGPCKMLASVIDGLSEDVIAKRVEFAKLNIDEGREIASFYGVMSVPTLILFKNGEEQVRMVGVHPKDAIADTIEDYL